MTYVHVTPREHDAKCRRGIDPSGPHYGLDRERCERCRNLWQRIVDAGARREARAAEVTS